VVKISKKFVEAVVGREHVVAVAEVVFSELAGDIALRLEQRRDGGIFEFHALWRAGEADFRETGADGRLAGDEGRAAGGAGLLAIPIGEIRALAAMRSMFVESVSPTYSHILRTLQESPNWSPSLTDSYRTDRKGLSSSGERSNF
jgi:hypothetical protein